MRLFTKDIKNMDDLFMHTLRDIYYAENQIVKTLPDMIEKASDPQLKQGFKTHLNETKNHVQRLDRVFESLGQKAQGVDCPAIDGIIEEADDVAGEVADKRVLDAALIAAAQACAANLRAGQSLEAGRRANTAMVRPSSSPAMIVSKSNPGIPLPLNPDYV